MGQSKFSLLTIGAFLLLFLICSCDKSNSKNDTEEGLQLSEVEVDSSAYKYVKSFVAEQRERAKFIGQTSIRSFDTTKRVPILTYEFFIDNQELSVEDFFIEVDSANIKHLTRTMDRREVKTTEEEDTLVFSENGDRIHYELATKINAYSQEYINARLFDIDHVDLHYSKHDVLYLSLGSSITGAMSTQIYDFDSGGHITSFGNNEYDGSYYIGNGIISNLNNLKYDNLDDIDKIRVVIMIDDKFCFREFETKDIIEQEEVSTL